MTKTLIPILITSAAVAAMSFPGAALAQTRTKAAEETQVGEVVVTALKTDATLQETPATVTVLSGDTIAKQEIRDLNGLSARVPGLVSYSSPNGAGSVAIRGIGSSTAATSFDTAVGVFIDGVFAPRGRDFNTSLFDVANVQIVKGTQAAVLGKNTSIGAMVVTTRRPGSAFGYDVVASHEFELGSNNLDYGVDLPVSESLSLRFAGRVQRDEGWVHNDTTGSDGITQHGEYERLSALWSPTDKLRVFAYYQYEHVRRLGNLFELVNTDARNSFATEFQLDYHQQQSIVGQQQPDSVEDFTGQRALVEISYIGEWLDVTSITGWRGDKLNPGTILDSNLGQGGYTAQFFRDNTDQVSEEIRFSSKRSGPLRWTGGVLLYHNNWNAPLTTVNYGGNLAACTASSPTNFAGRPLAQPNTYGTEGCGAAFENYTMDTKTVSGYGQIDWDITDKLNLIAGARYTDEHKRVDVSRVLLSNYVTDTGFAIPPLNQRFIDARGTIPVGTQYRVNDTALDGGAALRYRFTDTFNIYASYGKGTKSGGVQNANYPQANGLVNDGIYPPEVARTVEGGFKGDFGRGHVYGAVFDTKVRDFQNALFNGVSFVLTQEQVKSKGAELEVLLRPMAGLDLFAAATYADTRYASGSAPASNVGKPFLRAPLFSINLQGAYTHALSDNYILTVEPSARFKDNYRFSTNPTIPISPSAWTYDLRVGVDNEAAGWGVALVGRNLSDEKIVAYAVPGQAAPLGVPAGADVALDKPRTIALQFTLRR
jgi:iron complex outermembrane receptor protein